MPWCRTFGAATTSSRLRSQHAFKLPPRSTSLLWRSDALVSNGFGMPPVDQMQQCPGGCDDGIGKVPSELGFMAGSQPPFSQLKGPFHITSQPAPRGVAVDPAVEVAPVGGRK